MSDNLDDLILTDPEPETPKSKGVLALLALIVLLIVVGAVLANMIFSSPDDEANATQSEAIKAPVVDINTNSSIDDNNIAEMNKETNNSNVDADLAPLDDSAMPSKVDTVSIDNNNIDSKSDNNNGDNDNGSEESKNLAGSIVTTKVKPGSNVAQTTVEKSVHKPKHVTHKPKVTKTVKKVSHKYGGSGSTYIQVGSFSKGPTESFIRKIRNAGFRYRIREVNGYRRVLVGPFTSARAKEVLGIVKSKISPSAFIKK